MAYEKEDVIKTWSEISHQEKKPVQLFRYASTMLYFNRPAYYLTEFSGDWAKEVQMSTQKLEFGKKVVDTKLGSRAAMHTQPFSWSVWRLLPQKIRGSPDGYIGMDR